MAKTPEQIDTRRARLVAEADEADSTVIYADLPGDETGRYVSGGDDTDGTIYLQHGMSSADEASALAHEVEHAVRDDRGPQSEAREAYIDEEAAENLIAAKAYKRAVAAVGDDAADIGVELDVSEEIVEAYERGREREAGECAIAEAGR